MKKNGLFLLLFTILGLVAGTLVANWLHKVPGLGFLTRPVSVSWSPSADLAAIRFDLNLQLDLTLLSIIGVAAAIWMYRKM